MNTSEYKKRNKIHPQTENSKYHQCEFIPQHPEKLIGGSVLCRSSWETHLAQWCDLQPSVLQWGTEVVSISYRDPSGINLNEAKKYNIDITNPLNWPIHSYYPDFYIKLQTKDGNIHNMLIEIKPYEQTQRPMPISEKAKLKDVRKFNNAAKTFLKNDAKWKAAKQWCDMHSMEFYIWTEKELKNMGLL